MMPIAAMRLRSASESPPPGPVVTFNPADKAPSIVLSGGNLVAGSSAQGYQSVRATHPLVPGRCCEFFISSGQPSPFCMVGVSALSEPLGNYAGATAAGFTYYEETGAKYNNGAATAYGPSWSTDDIIGMARIGDELRFWKNGAPLGLAFTLPSGSFYPVVSLYRTGHQIGLRAKASNMSQLYGGCAPMGS